MKYINSELQDMEPKSRKLKLSCNYEKQLVSSEILYKATVTRNEVEIKNAFMKLQILEIQLGSYMKS